MPVSPTITKLVKVTKQHKEQVAHWTRFRRSLEELDKIVGNDRIKRSIADCMLYLIDSKRDARKQPMLNIILSGPPVTG